MKTADGMPRSFFSPVMSGKIRALVASGPSADGGSSAAAPGLVDASPSLDSLAILFRAADSLPTNKYEAALGAHRRNTSRMRIRNQIVL
jgi:hypothetical protein